ncbi:hypothetical protein WDW86_18245 [Bdellovibrionota bacterium FG-2]
MFTRKQLFISRLLLLSAVLLVVLGCTKVNIPVVKSFVPSAALFPHSEGWGKIDAHGDYALKNGAENCLLCHQVLQKNNSLRCQSCHADYPHPKDWATPELHGVQASGVESLKRCATQCHGEDLAGGRSKVSCNGCHEVFPIAQTGPKAQGMAATISARP